MEPDFWYMCPIWFIYAFIVRVCIEAVCDHYHIADRFSKRFGWKKQRVEKWQSSIAIGISLAITFVIIVVISVRTGFDLLNWEWFASD